MEVEERPDGDVLLQALEALKKACKEIETHGIRSGDDGSCRPPCMRALLELETGSDDLLAGDPHLSTLSQLLSRLKALAFSIEHEDQSRGGGGGGLLGSLLRLRRSNSCQEISRVAGSIGTEIQSWIDRESTDRLVSALRKPPASAGDEDEREALLGALEARVSQGFDRGLQEVLLRSGAFGAIESALADPAAPKRVRERAASAALALVCFNKAVFVGPVLMGRTVGALVGMAASSPALCALRGLIVAIRSPLVDELLARGHIPRLVALLSATGAVSGGQPPPEVRVLTLECALKMGYYGRKEAIDAMMAEDVIKRLMELQRTELGGALIEMDGFGSCGDEGVEAGGLAAMGGWRRRWSGDEKERRFMAARPFASCVARWAIQLEVGEGLRQREKRAVKREIVGRVRDAAANQAEAATVLAEVLWGSTTWT